MSRESSNRTIPPSPSSPTSPTTPSSGSFRPTRTRRPSRGSSTLHSQSHGRSYSQSQPYPARPSAENGAAHTHANLPPPLEHGEKRHEGNGYAQPDQQAQARLPPGRALSTLPVLREEHRYCKRCHIVKPPRAHHCRSCGTCVLKFDHHCPWIGQCVGAQNQKFFFVFVIWAALFCLWTFTTLVGLNARAASHSGKSVDPQHIVIIVFSGLFALFTVAMFTTHAALISSNQTTVEHIAVRSLKERETETLDVLYPSCWSLAERRRERLTWDAEWGRIGREGNMWWLGDIRAHWEQVFGPRVWTWFLPIGSCKDKGLEYPRNPRFDADGRWLPRKQWPAELQ
ncbi:DHHC palmitoyltransferase-domain-containing protein [Gloeopeniophorella convolvens]|nr:DHHC palmitoyltransferase-domain-containing protein [Gloeopeniophorella convolvens]